MSTPLAGRPSEIPILRQAKAEYVKPQSLILPIVSTGRHYEAQALTNCVIVRFSALSVRRISAIFLMECSTVV